LSEAGVKTDYIFKIYVFTRHELKVEHWEGYYKVTTD